MTRKNKIAILLFHPLIHQSRVNSKLIGAVSGMEGVTTRFMYDLYPDFHIDVKVERQMLMDHDVIVWQHPLYWYSAPALLKEWLETLV